MVEDPHNGYVKAYVGGPDFRYFKYDAVTQQKKQVGSTIKPFLYTIAMQNGYSPCYEVENIPRSFELPGDHPLGSQGVQGQELIMGKWLLWHGGLLNRKIIFLHG